MSQVVKSNLFLSCFPFLMKFCNVTACKTLNYLQSITYSSKHYSFLVSLHFWLVSCAAYQCEEPIRVEHSELQHYNNFYKVSNWLNKCYSFCLTNQQLVFMILAQLNLLETYSSCEINSFLNSCERFAGNRQSGGHIDLATIDHRLAHQRLVYRQDSVADLIDFSTFSLNNDAALIDFAQLQHINL